MPISLSTWFIALAVLTAAAPQPKGQGVVRSIQMTKRSGFLNPDRSINLDALAVHRASARAKILRGLTNYERNTGETHLSVLNAPKKRGTSDPLTDDSGALWYGTISVGTPPISFTVDIDTGSSDFFIPGSDCDSTCSGHTLWDPSSSSTSQDTGKTVDLQYGDSSESSSVIVEEYTDTVSIAGLTVTNQALGVAKTYPSLFQSQNSPTDGLIGMAFQSLSAFNASPVFQTLLSENQVANSVFSIKLSSSGSELYLGGMNSDLYTGDFSYTPLTYESYWRVNMDNVQGNGQTILTNVDSVIDTGTTLILGDPSQVSALHSALGGTPTPSNLPGFYTFPCDSFPSIGLTFGGQSFQILPDALNLGQVSSGSSDCVSGISELDPSVPFWAVGDVFLQGVYTTFDVGGLRVGFAQLA